MPVGSLSSISPAISAEKKNRCGMAHLAEMVFNLHTIEGFDSCIAQMKSGEIESGFA
jgi:hypothetical protein